MLYNIFFETFGTIVLIYSILNDKKNSNLIFRNVSKTKNETFYLHISKICCNFAANFKSLLS